MKQSLAASIASSASVKVIPPRTLLLVCGLALTAAVLTSCGGGQIGPPPPRQLISVTVQPSSSTATQGNTVPFSATGTFNHPPNTQTNLPAQWTSSDTNIATVDVNTGVATCVSVGGPVNITASAAGKGGMVSGSATLTCQVSPDPIATLNPNTQDFLCLSQTNNQGQKACSGKAPGGNTATLTNTGGSDLDISRISAGPQDFILCVSETDTCSGTTVTPGQSCTITVGVQWNGGGKHLFSGAVSIYDNAADSPQTISVSGITDCD